MEEILKDFSLFNEHSEEVKKVPKSVRFDKTVRMVLIPTRNEYFDARLAQHLWYNKLDLIKMEKEAILSISLGHYYDNSKDLKEDEDYGCVSQVYPIGFDDLYSGSSDFLFL